MSEETKNPAVEAEEKTEAKEAPQTEAKEEPTGPGERYEFADVYFQCNQCGHENKLAEGLRGISYTVPAAENAEVSMECEACKAKLRLYFKESSEEVKELRRAELAEMEKQENGTTEDNTDKEAGSGSTEDTERSPESDSKGDDTGASTDGDGSELEAKN
ncbi:MAG TPA: hypothetical protein VJ907_05895 [Halanaerobiales bacterium]|nr:hypothetical protein [Halanaerobiales bacterium]